MKKDDEFDIDSICLTPDHLRDDKCFNAASHALQAWLDIPPPLRCGERQAQSDALLDAAFGLINHAWMRDELAQYGLSCSLGMDDAAAFATFHRLGAKLEYAKPQAESEIHNAYRDAWEVSVAFECAKRGAYRCLSYLASLGHLIRDSQACSPLLREPEHCALREVNRELLSLADQRNLEAIGVDPKDPDVQDVLNTSHELILALLGAHSEQSEHLSMSIATSELFQSNPLFMLFSRQKTSRAWGQTLLSDFDSDAMHQLCADLAKQGLYDGTRASHRHALLQACAQGSRPAIVLALNEGVRPSQEGREIEKVFMESFLPFAKPPNDWPVEFAQLARDFTEQPSFGCKLFGYCSHSAERAARDIDSAKGSKARDAHLEAEQSFRRLALCSTALTQSPWDKPAREDLDKAAQFLDAILLETRHVGKAFRSSADDARKALDAFHPQSTSRRILRA